MISRRAFVKNASMVLFGTGLVPSFLYRTALAGPPGSRGKILVNVFLRGGLDGLNAVVPFREKAYYESRPRIAIPGPSRGRDGAAIDLNGRFGLHPSLKPLEALYRQGHLAILHAVGSPDSSRSHFEAQDFMESAAPGDKSVRDGWLSRYLAASEAEKDTAFRGVAMGNSLPLSLRGPGEALAMGRVSDFGLRAGSASDEARSGYRSLYSREADALLSGTAEELFEAIEFLKKANPGRYQPASGVRYPPGPFGRDLRQLAQLIKAGVGVEVAFVDAGGWDHHVNEGGSRGQLSRMLGQLAQGLAAFHRDLGPRMDDVLMLTMSEFGRTVRENGNAGTDHGHANVMLALGGSVRGGRLYGRWPGLDRSQLFEGRDLAHTSDFRDVFAEVLANHLGSREANRVFPGFRIDTSRFLGFV